MHQLLEGGGERGRKRKKRERKWPLRVLSTIFLHAGALGEAILLTGRKGEEGGGGKRGKKKKGGFFL